MSKFMETKHYLDDEEILPKVKTKKSNVHSVGSFSAIALCLYIGVLFVITMYVDRKLPIGLKLDDESVYPNEFIAERAKEDLRNLTSLGPRVTGSGKPETLSILFIQTLLGDIKSKANKVHEIEIYTQHDSGSYYLDYRPFGGYNAYGLVPNIVARIKGKNPNSKGILINSHFDSVPTSPGASDDGINCVVMLEILRKLTQLPNRRESSIYFLFNGAEETPLQASHGFITQHKWSEDIAVLINLEAAGSGGKEILFQSGPGHSWLLDYYKNVPHPHGQVAGEEIFQSNFVPSDTDFRIFRDFGGLIGYDMAFARNGYRYHTKYDNFESIPLGSYQHVGDNILHLVKSLSKANELNQITFSASSSSKKAVYFDILGFYMITYDEVTALAINVFVIVFSLGISFLTLQDFGLKLNKNTITHLTKTVGLILIGWVLAVINTLIIGVLLDWVNRSMSWFSKPWMLIGLYIIPSCVSCGLPMMLWNKYKGLKFGINIESQFVILSNRLIWTFVLLLGTCLKIRSSYVIMIPVLFNTIFSASVLMFNQQYSIKLWRIIYVIINSPPVVMIMYQGILVLSLFMPITGRIGSDRNPEIIVGLITSLVTILISSFFVHYVPILKNPKVIFAPLIVTLITLGIVFTPIGFPYSGDHFVPSPQRYMIYHTNRIVHDEHKTIVKEDSGLYVLNMDRNAPGVLKPFFPDIDKWKLNVDECKEILVCGMPLPSPRVLAIMNEQLWIPKPAHKLPKGMRPKLTMKMKQLSSTKREYEFTVEGSSHMNVYFSPKTETKLIKISLSDVIPENAATWNNRSIYFINYSTGNSKPPLRFTIQLEIPVNWNTKPALDIALAAHEFVNFSESEFLRRFPSWTDIIFSQSTYESWIY